MLSRSLKSAIDLLKLKHFQNVVTKFSIQTSSNTENNTNNKKIIKISDEKLEPLEPVICCGSGCQNCVWLQYAEKLLDYYKNNQEKSQEGIKKVIDEIEKLPDENLKAFLLMELKMKL